MHAQQEPLYEYEVKIRFLNGFMDDARIMALSAEAVVNEALDAEYPGPGSGTTARQLGGIVLSVYIVRPIYHAVFLGWTHSYCQVA